MKHDDSMMRTVAKLAWGLVVGVLSPATCWAHPGHGVDGANWSARHYFTEPVHLVGGALAVAVLLIGAALWRILGAHRTRHQILDAIGPWDCQSARAKQL
jgi:hypothetical protein